jgi:hypothetical protein
VVQIPGCGRFISKAPQVAGCAIRLEHFDGNNPPHFGIKRSKDPAKSPAPHFGLDFKSADAFYDWTGSGGHRHDCQYATAL